MLKLHFAEKCSLSYNGCPMSSAVQYSFVSQLTSSNVTFAEHDGPLGIKCCFQGEEIYEVEGGRFAVDNSSYLVLNQGQRYASSIHSRETVESFCCWFRPTFAEQVLGSLCTPEDRLLADPALLSKQPVLFVERVYPHDALVSPLLLRIHKAAQHGTISQPWLEEQFHLLLQRLLQAHRNIYREVERLPAIRQATRLELYRRLHRAKDYLDASWETPVTLAEVANVASLSPHHFLRQFRALFHETPHQYHRRKRLGRARHLLVTTEQPVTEICFSLGFESLGSFSWLFHQYFGLSPRQYRAEHARHARILKLAVEEPIGASEANAAPHADASADSGARGDSNCYEDVGKIGA